MEKKLNKKRVKKNKKPKNVLVITTIYVICFSVIAGAFAYTRINKYEEGVLEVCATQQDAYVQLVLDQINLKDNRDDEEIINDLLKTMDSSSNKYWAFSKNQSMLFVKDVLETNRYKGVSADTYYNARQAADFMNGLVLNKVEHSVISLDNKTYLVSGVMFKYAGQDYRLCLMTEKSVLLDNNTYLEIKVQMETFVVVILLALVLVASIYALRIRQLSFKLDEKEADIRSLSMSLSKVNEKLMDKDLHDTHNNVWRQKAIVPFMKKLIERNIMPVTFARVECENKESRNKFLGRAVYVLDRDVIRFEYGDSDIILLAVNVSEAQLKYNLGVLEDKDVKVQRVMLIDNSTDMKMLEEKYL